MDSFSLIGMLVPGAGALFGLYMLFTAHFPANFFFASRGYRLHQSAPESSGIWVRIAGGLWLIASALKFLGNNSDIWIIAAIIAGVAGLACLIISFYSRAL